MPTPTNAFQFLSSLPHGPAFRFVDHLLSLEPGLHAEAVWKLKGDEAFLEGHFPGNPILPGVIMIEALAQLGGILAQSARHDCPLLNMRLTAVRQFKILGTIIPGESLRICVRSEATLPGLVQVSGEVFALESGVKIASGSVILSGEEPPPSTST